MNEFKDLPTECPVCDAPIESKPVADRDAVTFECENCGPIFAEAIGRIQVRALPEERRAEIRSALADDRHGVRAVLSSQSIAKLLAGHGITPMSFW